MLDLACSRNTQSHNDRPQELKSIIKDIRTEGLFSGLRLSPIYLFGYDLADFPSGNPKCRYRIQSPEVYLEMEPCSRGRWAVSFTYHIC